MPETPLNEDELRQIEAYQIALSLMGGGNIAPRLHKLLNLLECRDLMRRKRRQDGEHQRRQEIAAMLDLHPEMPESWPPAVDRLFNLWRDEGRDAVRTAVAKLLRRS